MTKVFVRPLKPKNSIPNILGHAKPTVSQPYSIPTKAANTFIPTGVICPNGGSIPIIKNNATVIPQLIYHFISFEFVSADIITHLNPILFNGNFFYYDIIDYTPTYLITDT